jgi:hypothetical protein
MDRKSAVDLNAGLAQALPAPLTTAQLSGYEVRYHQGGSKPCLTALSSYQMSLDEPQREVDEPHQISHQISPTARGFLPAFRITVILAALTLSFIIPWLLVTNLINPLVVWLICFIGALLQVIYHVPVLILEVVGMIRGRPWLVVSLDAHGLNRDQPVCLDAVRSRPHVQHPVHSPMAT